MNRLSMAFVAGVLLLGACGERTGQATTSKRSTPRREPIFRTVHLEGSDVVLGQPLRAKHSLGTVMDDSVVRLANARFGGAKDIWILLGPHDTVRGMRYDYGVDSSFDMRVADYVKVLGPPLRRSSKGTPDVDLTDVVEWEDSLTHFELRWITRGNAAVAQSVLLDRRPLAR